MGSSPLPPAFLSRPPAGQCSLTPVNTRGHGQHRDPSITDLLADGQRVRALGSQFQAKKLKLGLCFASFLKRIKLDNTGKSALKTIFKTIQINGVCGRKCLYFMHRVGWQVGEEGREQSCEVNVPLATGVKESAPWGTCGTLCF